MTRDLAITILKEAQKFDNEASHILADRTLCEFLFALGYTDVVAEYETLKLRFEYA